MKQCTKCKETKPFTEFTKGPDNGYRYQCRACNNVYQLNPERRKKNSANYYAKRKQTNPALFMWKQAKHRAQWDYENMEFTITVEDIIIPEKCPYLGVEFQALDKRYGYSLDRIDSTKGYVKDNIQVISRLANIMKNNATEQELISFAKGVLDVHLEKVGRCVNSM
jgi:hypothetical protein